MENGNAQVQLVEKLLTVPEERLFAPDADFSDLAWAARKVDVEGVWLKAPAEIDVAQRDSLPLLVFQKLSGARLEQVAPINNFTVVVTPLDGGPVYSGPLFEKTRHVKKPASEREDDDEVKPKWSTSVRRVDLRALLKLPWALGRYIVRVIALDRVSNPVIVKLKGQPQEEPAPLQSPREPPDYRCTPQTPPQVGQGVALAVPTENPAGEPHLMLRGRVKMTLVPRPPGAAATLSASLLFARLDVPNPKRLDLQVPVSPEGPSTPGELGQGCFALDLKTAFPSPLAPGDYRIYLFAGEHLTGPHRLVIPPLP